VEGQKTDSLDVGFGLKILANALAAFGATTPSLDVAFHRARKVQFAYTNVTSTVVSPLDAGEFMTSGTLHTDNPVVKHYFMDPEAEAFLIVDVLKSDSITVTATDDHGVEVGVDVPAIQGVVGANVKVKTGGTSNSTLTFTGPTAVSFGFIVQQIEFDGAKWSMQGADPGGALSFGVGGGAAVAAEPTSGPTLLTSACRVNLR